MRSVDGLCAECGGPTSSYAGNPGEWPIGLPRPNNPGRPVPHHVKCVLGWRDRAYVTPDLADTALAAMAGTGIATPLEGYLKVPSQLAANIRALAKERDELRLVLNDFLEGKGVSLDDKKELLRLDAILQADGCYDCAFPTNSIQHHHHPNDRAATYRLMLGPPAHDDMPESSGSMRNVLRRLLGIVLGR